MPLDTTGYTDFRISLGPADVETPQALELQVNPALNAGADVLCSYSGILRFAAKGTSTDKWDRGSLVARVPTAGRNWSNPSIYRGPGWTVFRGATATVSLASIYNAGAANYAGWAVDAAQVEAKSATSEFGDVEDHLEIQALLAVRDTDGILYRVSYQVIALGNYIPLRGFPVGAVSSEDRPVGRDN
jgi:hypothetical protein